jgi:hypothetical protein
VPPRLWRPVASVPNAPQALDRRCAERASGGRSPLCRPLPRCGSPAAGHSQQLGQVDALEGLPARLTPLEPRRARRAPTRWNEAAVRLTTREPVAMPALCLSRCPTRWDKDPSAGVADDRPLAVPPPPRRRARMPHDQRRRPSIRRAPRPAPATVHPPRRHFLRDTPRPRPTTSQGHARAAWPALLGRRTRPRATSGPSATGCPVARLRHVGAAAAYWQFGEVPGSTGANW